MQQAQQVRSEVLRLALGDPELLEIVTAPGADAAGEDCLRKVFEQLAAGGRANDVQTLSERVLAIRPESAAALYALGLNHYLNQRFAAAIDPFEALLRLTPENYLARGYLGVAYSLGETHASLAKAREHLRLTLVQAPDWSDIAYTLARTCTSIGPVAEAAQLFRALLAKNPNDGRNHYLLSEVLSDLGEYEAAKTHLACALELGFRGSRSAEADIKAIDATPKAKKKIIRSRYPDTEDMKSDFLGVIKKTVISDLNDLPAFITPETRFFTLGSCFARHMARALKEAGHECYHIEVGDVINTTYANRAIMEWIAGTLDPALEQRMNDVVGALTTKENFVEQIRKADVFIFTMGVAACFFERDTGRFVMPRPTSINSRALAETYDFRTTRVSENVANMKFIIDAMRAINPKLKIFITVSPVPLHVTFERNASVVGDCLSKSVMRVSADELMHSGYEDIHYWPSFEIVRWLSGHVGPFFGVDDGASWHISEKLIEQIIGLFLERFTPPEKIAA